MFDFIVCAVSNLFRIYLIYRFAEVFLGRKLEEKHKAVLVYLCFFAANTLLFWEFHTAWINITCNLAGTGAIVWLYTKTIKTNLFVTSTICLIHMGCDVVATLLFISYQDGQVHSQVYAAAAVFLIFICELLSEKVITNRKDMESAPNFSLIIVPLSSVIVIWLLIYSGSCGEKGIAIVGMGLLVINFFMLYLYNLLLHSLSQKYESEMLRQKVQVYANQLDVILQNEEKVKALKQDMKYHMNEIRLLANKSDMAGIHHYIDEMEVFIHNPKETVASGNMEIDSLLNYMLQRAKEELETVCVKVMLPEKIQHTFDINVLLGNLLENAIEAAKQTDQKYLSVNIILSRGVLDIQIENSFLTVNDILKDGHRIFLTTKKEKEGHGIGLNNVQKIVESYNGAMKVETTDDIFCVRVILYMAKMEKI